MTYFSINITSSDGNLYIWLFLFHSGNQELTGFDECGFRQHSMFNDKWPPAEWHLAASSRISLRSCIAAILHLELLAKQKAMN